MAVKTVRDLLRAGQLPIGVAGECSCGAPLGDGYVLGSLEPGTDAPVVILDRERVARSMPIDAARRKVARQAEVGLPLKGPRTGTGIRLEEFSGRFYQRRVCKKCRADSKIPATKVLDLAARVTPSNAIVVVFRDA